MSYKGTHLSEASKKLISEVKRSKTKKNAVCITCGKSFHKSPFDLKRIKSGPYCSHKCRADAQKKRIIIQCEYCHTEIEIQPYRLKNQHHFCSRDCQNKYRMNGINLNCIVCGKTFYRIPSCIKEFVNGPYCSKSCRGKHLSDLQRGPNSHIWKGGISYEPYCPAFNRSIKEFVRNRFGRQCFLCGAPENKRGLAVHHCDFNKSQGCVGTRWSLIPLCGSCHAKTNHHRFFYFNLLRDYWINDYIDFASKTGSFEVG